jgi:hypothetical protein
LSALQPLPNVYLAWSNDGLYLGLEVFDNDIEGASAKGWWWTKDNVELWISTKPVGTDQNTYDVNCHQFFFVPNDLTASNGVGGVVGQWHREGDARDRRSPDPAPAVLRGAANDQMLDDFLVFQRPRA